MQRRQLVSCGLLIVMIASYWFLLARGELAEIRDLRREVDNTRSSLITAEAASARFEEVQRQVDEVQGWIERVRGLYETGEEDPDFLLDIARAMKACGLTPSVTSPGPVEDLDPMTGQSIRLVVEGELGDVFEFVHRMEDSTPLCRVTGLVVEPARSVGGIRADLTLLRLWRKA